MWLQGLKVCVTTALPVRLISVAVLGKLIFRQALFIKIQMKYQYINPSLKGKLKIIILVCLLNEDAL